MIPSKKPAARETTAHERAGKYNRRAKAAAQNTLVRKARRTRTAYDRYEG